jgi:hypothetical protein
MSLDDLCCSFTHPVIAVLRGETKVPSNHGGMPFSSCLCPIRPLWTLFNLSGLLNNVYYQVSTRLIRWKWDYDQECKIIKKANEIW